MDARRHPALRLALLLAVLLVPSGARGQGGELGTEWQPVDPARQALGVACRIGPGRRCIGRHWREESPCSWQPSPVRRGKPECRSKRDGRHVAHACHPSGRCP